MNTASSRRIPDVIHDTVEMQRLCLELRRAGRRIAFVPTMGYLHDGHLSLLREGRRRGDVLVLSIFVNPTQFGPNEDLDSYPRDLQHDLELAAAADTDLVYAPLPGEVYPDGYATFVDVEGLTDTLCGASRPHHFRGVTTVVSKLFNVIQPDVALFGRKDFQQLAVVRRMTRDLNFPVEIIGMPIVREEDGLAMSSRNVYLSAAERCQALSLFRALMAARDMARCGETRSSAVLEKVRNIIEAEPETRIDYARICHQETLNDQPTIDVDSVILLAVRIGTTRLIDNAFLLADESFHA